MSFKEVKHRRKDQCAAYRCKNTPATRDRFCSKHRARYRKENNPLLYAFRTIQSNAIRRGKNFNLTLEQFEKFCADTGYLERRGRMMHSLTIDRIDPLKGYEIGNIQAVTKFENDYKGGTSDAAAHSGECPF